MALYVGKITCAFCGLEIEDQRKATHLPQFAWNQADPLFPFGDSMVHNTCLSEHPLAAKVHQRLAEFEDKTSPAKRRCLLCGDLITDPDDYLGMGHLVESPAHELHRYNFAHFHRGCLNGWNGGSGLVAALEKLDSSDEWKGGGLKWLISELRKLSADAQPPPTTRG